MPPRKDMFGRPQPPGRDMFGRPQPPMRDMFGRPVPPPPPGRARPPRHGSMAGDILIGGMLAGLGELLEESMETLETEEGQEPEALLQNVKLPSECPFCGAPAVSSVCEYCGRNVAQDK